MVYKYIYRSIVKVQALLKFETLEDILQYFDFAPNL